MAVDDVEARLEKCFLLVFPDQPPAQLRAASRETVRRWDSLATVTLFALVEEEFSIKFAPEDFVVQSSFALLVESVRSKITR